MRHHDLVSDGFLALTAVGFMLLSAAAMKRGSMKIDPPEPERTRSQELRSTWSIESKTR